MNPLKVIEKWINEHASAAALRDHVALLKDQITVRDNKITSLEKENKRLETLNTKLNSENDNFQQQAEITKAANQPFPQPGLIHGLDKRKRRAI